MVSGAVFRGRSETGRRGQGDPVVDRHQEGGARGADRALCGPQESGLLRTVRPRGCHVHVEREAARAGEARSDHQVRGAACAGIAFRS